MLASLPYTTAMFFTLFCWMLCFSVLFSSSDTKPMKELSGVWALEEASRKRSTKTYKKKETIRNNKPLNPKLFHPESVENFNSEVLKPETPLVTLKFPAPPEPCTYGTWSCIAWCWGSSSPSSSCIRVKSHTPRGCKPAPSQTCLWLEYGTWKTAEKGNSPYVDVRMNTRNVESQEIGVDPCISFSPSLNRRRFFFFSPFHHFVI